MSSAPAVKTAPPPSDTGPLPPPPVPLAREGRPFKSFLRYNRRYWRRYLGGALLAGFFMVVSLIMPLVIRMIVNGFENNTMTMPKVIWLFVALIAISLVSGVARYFERVLMIGASRLFEYDIRNDLFAHAQRLSRRFFNKTPTGDIMARATNDLNFVREFVGPGIMGTIDLVRVPVTLAMMLYLSTRLTLISLVPLPLISLMVYGFIRYSHRQSKKVQELFSVVNTSVQENLAGARVVKAYGMEEQAAGHFEVHARKYMRENIMLSAVMSFGFPFIGSIIGLITLVVVWQGGGMVIAGTLPLADFTAFMIYLTMLVFPLAHFGWILTLYQRGAVGMNRIAQITTAAPDIWDDEQTNGDAEVAGGGITFENVSFGFTPDTPMLDSLDFEAPAGATVAIVGPTGCGKTSLVSLIAREYDVDEGRILVDGHEIRTIPVRRLRGAIGYVPQDAFIFSDSIRENLRMGRPEATDADILAACGVAQFTSALEEMPKGLDTLLGERGINLSGGQKQRLSLARAILREPRILILDDSLSAVDTHTEEQILRGLRGVMAERTSFIVSHRISTIRHADLILVLSDGRIAERGGHDDLLVEGGIYARMYERQLLEEALES